MKPEIGVCYYPEHWPEENWQNDAIRMVETGIVWVRIGEFAWSRLEAKEGEFTWEWLDRAVDILANAGLKIIMGTPSATPPRWIVNKYPDMLAVDIDGRERKFGSRRHYCFSHRGYRQEAVRMAEQMALRYGKHQAVQAWQIDNEYGCHDTTISFSDNARKEFQHWLGEKYQSIDELNNAWGNVFWSMEYNEFNDIDLPHLTVTEANPTHCLDFRRFTSDQVVAFNLAQIKMMRPHTKAPFTHNYMGRVLDFDHFAVGENLEIASWDSYPMGFLEQFIYEESEEWKAEFSQQGDPDFQAFHHDLYRAVGRGRWWVMEQQPGPVNWALYNPIPVDGMVKLWGMEAVAHGAELVSYFRWRQAPFAQEQLHAGLLRPDGANSQGQIEVAELAKELEEIGDLKTVESDVAIVFDYESQWAWEIQPQGHSFDYFRLIFECYRALRKLGLSIDILPSNTTDFGCRKLVLIPGLMTWNDGLRSAITAFEGTVLCGPRTGLKTENMHIPKSMGPDFAAAKVLRVSSLRPNVVKSLHGEGNIIKWFEELEANEVYLADIDNNPVVVREQSHFYLSAWLDSQAYEALFKQLCELSEISIEKMPGALRKRKCGQRELYTNYGLNDVEHEGIVFPKTAYVWQ